MKIIEAHQVPDGGNVSANIFKLLPIVAAVKDSGDKGVFYTTRGSVNRKTVFPGDWVCKDAMGRWQVLTDEEYKNMAAT